MPSTMAVTTRVVGYALRSHFVGLCAAGALVIGVTSPVQAQLDISGAAHASTLGFGVEGAILLTPHLAARAMYNFFNYSFTLNNSGISYDGKVSYRNAPLLIDYYPGSRGSFHLSGGLVFNQNNVSGPAKPDASGNYTINHNTYSQAQVGTLTIKLDYPSSGWYAGYGFGTPAKGSRIGVVFDMGAFFSTPAVHLTSSNAAPGSPLANDLQAQADSTKHALKTYASIYPVISLGVNVRF
jgi:hypothetical protein